MYNIFSILTILYCSVFLKISNEFIKKDIYNLKYMLNNMKLYLKSNNISDFNFLMITFFDRYVNKLNNIILKHITDNLNYLMIQSSLERINLNNLIYILIKKFVKSIIMEVIK